MKPSTPRPAKPLIQLSCGVLVTDGAHLFLGHAAGSPRWDIPKGLLEPGEDVRHAALRELNEETGLVAAAGDLVDLGWHAYRPGKDLALFAWYLPEMPDPARLVCRSTFTARDGRVMPEFDCFVVAARGEAEQLVGKSMRSVLLRIGWLPGPHA